MNFNEDKLPVPYKTTTIHEFREKFAHETPSYIESRKIKFKKNSIIMNVQILYFHAVAFGILFPLKWHLNKEKKQVYDKPVQYIKIGCQHKYIELTQEQCASRNLIHYGISCHVKLCSKCGMIEVESSEVIK